MSQKSAKVSPLRKRGPANSASGQGTAYGAVRDEEEEEEDFSESKQRDVSVNVLMQMSKRKRQRVMASIISCELCERLAFYGLIGSLQLFLKRRLNQSTAEASSNVALFAGACYFCTLAGGFISDSLLGKFKTILVFALIYEMGLLVVSLVSFNILSYDLNNGLFWVGLYLVALGTGGIKPCVSTLGAEQFETDEVITPDSLLDPTANSAAMITPKGTMTGAIRKESEMSEIIHYNSNDYNKSNMLDLKKKKTWKDKDDDIHGSEDEDIIDSEDEEEDSDDMKCGELILETNTTEDTPGERNGSMSSTSTMNSSIQPHSLNHHHRSNSDLNDPLINNVMVGPSASSAPAPIGRASDNIRVISIHNQMITIDESELESFTHDITQQKESFFRWFYFSINSGSFLSFTIVAYLCQEVSFAAGYMIPTVSLALSIIFFISASQYYRKTPPSHEFELWTCIKIITEAAWIRCCLKNDSNHTHLSSLNVMSNLNKTTEKVVIPAAPNNDLSLAEASAAMDSSTNYTSSLDKFGGNGQSSLSNDQSGWMSFNTNQNNTNNNNNNDEEHPLQDHWLMYADINQGGSYQTSQIEACYFVWKLSPFLWFLILYWAIYAQMSALFYAQGCQMDLTINPLGSSSSSFSFDIPIATLQLFNVIPILLFVPLMDKYLLPYLRHSLHLECTMLQRMGVGLLIASLSMFCAALIEYSRKNTHNLRGKNSMSTCDDTLPVSSMSILWQIPQFLLIGLSEVFTSITSLEFFFSESPQSMRTTLMALNLITNAFGSWLVPILIAIANADKSHPWISDDLDKGHLDLFFGCMALLNLVSFVLYVRVAQQYRYQNVGQTKDQNNYSKKTKDNRKQSELSGSVFEQGGIGVYQTPGTQARREAAASSVGY